MSETSVHDDRAITGCLWRPRSEWRSIPFGHPAREVLVIERETGNLKVWIAQPQEPIAHWHAAWCEKPAPPPWFRTGESETSVRDSLVKSRADGVTVMTFNLTHVPPGWHFVNLFSHEVAGLFYCRLRHGMKVSDREVTGRGATPNLALADATSLTLEPHGREADGH